ncbi:unnamed protein product, partial [Mesorhabditis belari]|uniref:Uncharacterized protein n=1 Tax=Mesorhabditis belari TaxID=2138241 RepID=A0AAF3J698_9BILA
MYLLFAVLLSHVLPAILSLPICTKCPTGGIWSRWRDTTDCTKSCGLNAKATATTPANPCARCTLAELLALGKPNSAIFTPVFGYDSVTGCAQVSGNCSGEALNDYLAIGAHAAAGPPGPFGYVCGCGSVNTKPEAPFVCSPDGKWQYGGQTIGDWYCYVYYDCLQQIAWYAGTILDACPTATPSTTTPAPLIPAP